MQRLFSRIVTSNPRLLRPKSILLNVTYIQTQQVKRTIHLTSVGMADITPIQAKEACPGMLAFPSHLNPVIEPPLKVCAHPVAGPYSQAIRTPHAIYVSGQLPALADGTLPSGTMAYKASLCIKNIHEILKEAGSDLSKVVKMTVFLTDMKNFAEVNREYELHFPDTKPARSCVAVKELPKGVEVEMECVALP